MSKLLSLSTPHIIRGGRSRELAIDSSAMRIAGYVTVDLLHARTGLIKQHLEFRNLVVDAGLDALGAGTPMSSFVSNGYCAVGTGSTAPANNQTGLDTQLGNRTNNNGGIANVVGSGTAFSYWYNRITRLFLEAESNGNLTEFGMFSAAVAGTMFARQLFKDGVGNPTVITKTSADQLRITYEVRIYPPTVDGTGLVAISGTTYTYTSRAANIGTASAWGASGATGYLEKFGTNSSAVNVSNATALGTTSAAGPTGSTASAGADTVTITPYVAGSFYREVTYVWNAASANFTGGSGGASGFAFFPFGTASSVTQQALVAPVFAKDNTKRLTVAWRFPFTRYP